jgi:hypothetical protein
MKLKNVIIIVLVAVTGFSCISTRFNPKIGYLTQSERRTVSLSPDIVRLELDIDDFENLGSVEVSLQTREYLGGAIFKLDSVNGQPFNSRDVKIVNLLGTADIKLKKGAQVAAYKVVDEFPDADYYVVSHDYQKEQRLFGGKKVWRYIDIQAWKYKN